jgi:hypothetical protein
MPSRKTGRRPGCPGSCPVEICRQRARPRTSAPRFPGMQWRGVLLGVALGLSSVFQTMSGARERTLTSQLMRSRKMGRRPGCPGPCRAEIFRYRQDPGQALRAFRGCSGEGCCSGSLLDSPPHSERCQARGREPLPPSLCVPGRRAEGTAVRDFAGVRSAATRKDPGQTLRAFPGCSGEGCCSGSLLDFPPYSKRCQARGREPLPPSLCVPGRRAEGTPVRDLAGVRSAATGQDPGQALRAFRGCKRKWWFGDRGAVGVSADYLRACFSGGVRRPHFSIGMAVVSQRSFVIMTT